MVVLAPPEASEVLPEFPFRCGVTEPEFVFWATVQTDYRGRVWDWDLFHRVAGYDRSPDAIQNEFCRQCEPAFRRAAIARGACIDAER